MELYTGLTQRVYLDIYKEDELTAADALPSVKVYDGKTDVLLANLVAKAESDDEGHYSAVISDNILDVDKEIKVVWDYSVSQNSMQSVDYYFVVTPYLSTHDIYTKLHLGREHGDANYVDFHEIKEAEKFARFMIENYIGAKFGKYAGTVTAYGQDADILWLGERIISFTSLKENGRLVIDSVNGINDFNYPVEITDTNHSLRIVSNGDDINEGGQLDIVYPLSGNFYNGYRYEVTGVFGWKRVPEKIQTAALMLVKDYFGKDHIWRTRYVNKVSFGDTDMDFSKLAFRGTGNFYVDKLLDEFKSTNMAVI